MAPNLNLVPNIKSKVLLILAVVAVATGGLFEQRTKVTLNDGTVVTGKEVEPDEDAPIDESKLILERASGYLQTIDRADIADSQWFNIEVNLNLGLDLRGGTSLRYRLDFDKDGIGEVTERESVLNKTVETFQSRLDKLGVKEVSVYSSGTDEIIVELPGVTMEESESYEQVVGSLGSLQFLIKADSRSSINVASEEQRVRDHLRSITDGGGTWSRKTDLSSFDLPGSAGIVYRWFPYSEKAIEENPSYAEFPFMLLEVNPAINFTGEDLSGTFVTQDDRMFPAMGFRLKSSRASDFGAFTGANVKRQMAILLDNEVHSAPELQSEISDQGQISGGSNGFTQDELKSLRTTLDSGSLKVHPVMLSKATIGPSLGKASINNGVTAGMIAGLMVLVFMLVYYRTTGFISALTLIIGIYVLMGGLGFLDATLTLPGIAGILLTLGMAVDQNILINERIREEREKGKTLAQAIKNGFERAFVTIVDAQATTFLAGFILFKFGTGPIKGFAVTLMLGILTTMFAALVGSKTIFAIGLARDWFKDLKQMSILGTTTIRFTGYLRPCLTASAIAIIASIAFFGYEYEEMKGLDFAGGFQAQIRTKTPMSQLEIKEALQSKYPNAIVVTMVSEDGETDGDKTTDFMIKIKSTPEEREAEASGAEDQRGAYVNNLRALLSGRLIADGIAVGADDIQPQPGGRAVAKVTLNFDSPIDQAIVESRLSQAVTVRSVTPAEGTTSPSTSYVVETLEASSAIKPEMVRAGIAPTMSELPGGIRLSQPLPSSQFIGGRVGKELRNSAIKAILLAIVAILIYIRIRFHDVNYGIAACVAVAHDVIIGLGAITVAHVIGIVDVDLDLAMIGAFLTIIGYSLNDTIVIFDRVRENIPRMNKPLDEVIDHSVNQTLSRTMLTSITTFIAVVVLFIMNYGQRNVLEGFSFAIMVGIFVGTYSTIFIASPMLVWLTKRTAAQKAAAKAAAA